MERDIMIRFTKCMGCLSCQLACAAASPEKTLLAAVAAGCKPKIFVEQGDRYKIPLNCRQCLDAPCIDACMTGAMQRLESGLVSNQNGECSGCWMCVMVCPYGVIYPDFVSRTAVKCNRQCMAEDNIPACVRACPTGALSYVAAQQGPQAVRSAFAAKLEEGISNSIK